MAKCDFCEKGVVFGIQVSHSHRRSTYASFFLAIPPLLSYPYINIAYRIFVCLLFLMGGYLKCTVLPAP